MNSGYSVLVLLVSLAALSVAMSIPLSKDKSDVSIDQQQQEHAALDRFRAKFMFNMYQRLLQDQQNDDNSDSDYDGFNKRSKEPAIDCQMLCFIGQGGKACNCNYAPFVGK